MNEKKNGILPYLNLCLLLISCKMYINSNLPKGKQIFGVLGIVLLAKYFVRI